MQIIHKIIIFLLLFNSLSGYAQQVDNQKRKPTYYKNLPVIQFLKPSIKVGEPVQLVVVWKHAPEQEVFFPDSTYNFAPFEFLSKTFFPTKTLSLSTDSVIYELTSFETDTTLSLTLPAYILNEKDTTIVWTAPAKLTVKPLLVNMPDSLVIIDNTQLQNVQNQFNYWYWAGALVAIGVVVLVLFIIFGGRIRKSYRLSRMKKQYQRFVADFDKSLLKYQEVTNTEHGLSLWKNYLEGVLDVPFTSYTSKEIADIVPDKPLNESLKNIDRAIYGNQINETTYNSLVVLKNYAQTMYETKMKEVQNV